MSDDFDPYLEWLGIEPHERPINHYRLLGVAPFTSDMDRIRRAADERMSKVRQYQLGRRGSHTQPILNALAGAKLCLLNPNTKSTYDAVLSASLGMRQPPTHLPSGPTPRPAAVDHAAAHVPMAPPPPPPLEPPLAQPPPPIPPPINEPPRAARRDVPVATSDYRHASRNENRSSGLLPIALLLGVIVLVAGGWLLYYLLQQRQESPVAQQPPPAPSVNASAPQNMPPAEQANDPPAIDDAAEPVITQQEGSGTLQFRPSAAQLAGGLQLENIDSRDAISGFASPDDRAVWRFHLTQPGAFRARIEYAAIPGGNGAFRLVSPGNFDKERAIRDDAAGTVTDAFIVAIKRGGDHEISLEPRAISADRQLRIFAVELIPTRGGQ